MLSASHIKEAVVQVICGRAGGALVPRPETYRWIESGEALQGPVDLHPVESAQFDESPNGIHMGPDCGAGSERLTCNRSFF